MTRAEAVVKANLIAHDALLDQLRDENWKVRAMASQELKSRIAAALSRLTQALKEIESFHDLETDNPQGTIGVMSAIAGRAIAALEEGAMKHQSWCQSHQTVWTTAQGEGKQMPCTCQPPTLREQVEWEIVKITKWGLDELKPPLSYLASMGLKDRLISSLTTFALAQRREATQEAIDNCGNCAYTAEKMREARREQARKDAEKVRAMCGSHNVCLGFEDAPPCNYEKIATAIEREATGG